MTRVSYIAIGAFLLLPMMQANAQSSGQGFVIKGTIKGIGSGVVLMFSGDARSMVDSAIIVKGQFVMRGKIGLPERRAFTIVPGNWSFRGFVEDTVMTFAIDTTGAQHQYSGKKDYPMIWEIKQTGSKMADVYAQYVRETGQTDALSLIKKIGIAKNKTEVANIWHQMDSLRGPMFARQKIWVENYIHQYPASIVGVYMFNELYGFGVYRDASINDLQSAIDRFSGAAKNSIYYQQLTQVVANSKNTQANSPAPDFTLQKRDKTKFTLSATRGGYTMLDFWASWCVPCRAAIPKWKKVYAKYHLKGFNIVSVSTDESWKKWLTALDKEKMPWVQVIDEYSSAHSKGKVSELFPSRNIPFYVLLDKEGKVLLASGDEEAMNKKIAEVLP